MKKRNIKVEEVKRPGGLKRKNKAAKVSLGGGASKATNSNGLVKAGKRVVIGCLAVMAGVVINGIRQDIEDQNAKMFEDNFTDDDESEDK